MPPPPEEDKPSPKPSFCKEAENLCKRADTSLKKLVLAGEDEDARFRRRMHLHLCLIGLATGLALLSIWSIVDASSAICLTLGLNSTQELLDYAGKF
jgi:hypothetical protein